MTRACVIMNQGARNGTRNGSKNARKMTKRVKRSHDMNTRHKKTTGKHLEKIDIDNDKHLKDYKLIRESWVRQNHFIYYHGVLPATGSGKTTII